METEHKPEVLVAAFKACADTPQGSRLRPSEVAVGLGVEEAEMDAACRYLIATGWATGTLLTQSVINNPQVSERGKEAWKQLEAKLHQGA